MSSSHDKALHGDRKKISATYKAIKKQGLKKVFGPPTKHLPVHPIHKGEKKEE